MNRPVLIMAGGTGGHIFPGLAVAAELATRKVPVIWLGADGGLETRLVPQHGLPLETLAISGMRGKGLLTLLVTPLRLIRAVAATRAVLKRHAPRSALSMGGYAAAPGGIAAWLARIPVVVHEQNSVPGFTNRLLARFARRVLAGFDDAFAGATWVGNPVRASIAALPQPGERFRDRAGPLRVLVLGGSQGSHALNVAFPQALGRLKDLAIVVRHQCGPHHLERARRVYGASRVEVSVESFIEDMAGAYAWADLVVCRAGALTLAELCAAGVASVLVPFPQAVDDHQTRNATQLVAQGAAVLAAEGADFERRLADAIATLAADPSRRLAMAEAARSLAKPDAASHIADVCLEVAA
ncbi:undecaprenyldiphospho-muramoylpentapeptide beta-N-acetylglucosaminyltransferase [Dokdonella soli]